MFIHVFIMREKSGEKNKGTCYEDIYLVIKFSISIIYEFILTAEPLRGMRTCFHLKQHRLFRVRLKVLSIQDFSEKHFLTIPVVGDICSRSS